MVVCTLDGDRHLRTFHCMHGSPTAVFGIFVSQASSVMGTFAVSERFLKTFTA